VSGSRHQRDYAALKAEGKSDAEIDFVRRCAMCDAVLSRKRMDGSERSPTFALDCPEHPGAPVAVRVELAP
jgi:hypothetical protein